MISVLYVDDEPDLLDIAKLFLEHTGRFRIDTSTSVTEAQQMMRSTRYDAIISDYQMPVMNGIKFLQLVRKEHGHIPFILFTGRGREEVVIQALENGADFYIQKGGDPRAQFAELMNKIEKAVKERQSEEARKDSERRLADIINFLPDATLAIDRQGVVIAWNHAMELMTDVPASAILGKGKYEYALPFYNEHRPILLDLIQDYDPVAAGRYEKIRKEGNTLISEQFIPTMYGGKGMYLWFTASPFFDSRGNLAGAIESIRDITEQKKLVTSLRASERRYRNVFESSSEAMIVADRATGRILDANAEATRLYGYTLEEFRSMRSWDLTADSQRMIPQEQEGRMYIPHRDNRKKDGTVFPAEITGTIYPQKRRTIAIINVRDISDLKKAEEALCESEHWFRELSELLPQIVYEIDTSGILTYMNRIAFDLFGYSREEFERGMNVIDMIAPKDRARAAESIKALCEGKTDEGMDREYLALRKDGSTFPVMIYSSPVQKESRITGLRGIIIDISERKRHEEALVESGKKFRTILDQASDAIILHDRTGRIIDVNRKACSNLGYTKDELLRKKIPDFDPEGIRNGKDALWDKVVAGETFTFESSHVRKDGTAFPVEITLGSITLDNDILVMGVVRDIAGRKKIEESLSESEQRFQHISALMSDFAFSCLEQPGGGYRIDWMTGAVAQITGYSSEELKERQCWRCIVCEEDLPLYDAHILGLEPGASGSCELRIRHKNGSAVWLLCRTECQRDHVNPALLRIYGGCRDITNRKNLDLEIRRSEERYRTIFQNASDLVRVLDKDGKIVYDAPSSERILGYPARFFIGKDPFDFIHSGDRDRVRADLRQVYDRNNSRIPTEFRIRRADDQYLWVESVGVNLFGVPAVDGIVVTTRPIAERKQIEQELRESEEKFRGMAERSSDLIVILDKTMSPTYVSPSARSILGYGPEELVGKTPEFAAEKLLSSQKHHEFMNMIREHRKGMPFMNLETQLRRKDGTPLCFSVLAIPIMHDGAFAGAQVSLRDITERKQAEEALAQANRKLRLLSGITRHDMNNQLSVLRGYLSVLQTRQPDIALDEYFQKITAATNRISTMIQFAKEYEKIGSTVPSWHTCRTQVDNAGKQFLLGNIRLQNDLPAETEVFADPLVARVFYNLIDNALRYGGRITRVRFSFRETGDKAVIVCEDDGNGIPLDEKEQIFEFGFGKNTGLGLALSREILSITGITVTENGEPGKGARFEMVIPEGSWRSAGATGNHTLFGRGLDPGRI